MSSPTTCGNALTSRLLASVAVVILTTAGMLAGGGEALATPTGGTILAGGGNISTTVNPLNSNLTTTTITQPNAKGVYSWTGYNTSAGQTVTYNQPNKNSIALNIISGGPTNFDGTLNANGNVWLINPNGMLFGNATINVGSLLLSTASISNPTTTGFYTNTSGSYSFDQAGAATSAIILNGTSVTTTGNGSGIIIMAPAVAVQNASSLSAPGGNVALLAGSTFGATTTNVDFNGDGLINYQAVNLPTAAVVPGTGSSIYVGGASTISAVTVVAEASVYQDAVLDHVINLGGQYSNGTNNQVAINQVPYNTATNPEHVVIAGTLTTLEYLPAPPAPPVTPITPAIPAAPAATSSAASVPASAQNGDTDIDPLTRPLTSLAEESGTNASVANDAYAKPYFVSLPASVAEGKLTLLSPSAGGTSGSSPTNLGNLSPSAGGDGTANTQDNLGSLSPSAGGSITSGASSVSCANSYLDTAWLSGPTHRCVE